MQLEQLNDLYFQHGLYFQRLFSNFTINLSFEISKNWFARCPWWIWRSWKEYRGHFQTIADESFRLIDNDKNDNKSDSGQISVESGNNNFTFTYDEEIALFVERTKIWFDKFEIDNFF